LSLCRFCAVAGKAWPVEKRFVSVLRGAGNNAIASGIMRLSCPNCQTEYEVPDAALTGRARTLRCAKCMTKFQAPALDMVRPEPAAPDPEPAFVEAPDNDGEAVVIDEAEPAMTADEDMAGDETQASEAPRHEWVSMLQTSREAPDTAETELSSKRALRVSILMVFLIIAVVLAEHRAIGNLWPPSLRLFHALGLR
jgi:predicted Zn finger-like uncharacterized protein